MNEIKEQVYSLLKFNDVDTIKKEQTDKLVDKWYEAKRSLIESPLFNGQLTVQSKEPITFSLTPQERDELFEDFITDVCKYYNDEIMEYLYLNEEGFFDNIVVNNNGDKRIKVGSKLSKSLKVFFNPLTLSGQEGLRRLQDLASIYIQRNKIQGYLCLSVHPIDFLTASENNSKWDSCFRLNGAYKTGSLVYLLDSSTVIAYVQSVFDANLDNVPFKWNNKKWRAWLHFDTLRNIVLSDKHYPFECKGIIDTIAREFLSKDGFDTQFYNDCHLNVSGLDEDDFVRTFQIPTINEPIDLDDKIYTNSEHCFYDLIDSLSYQTPFYCYKPKVKLNEMPTWILGNEVECLCCGKHYIDDSESFVCGKCRENY